MSSFLLIEQYINEVLKEDPDWRAKKRAKDERMAAAQKRRSSGETIAGREGQRYADDPIESEDDITWGDLFNVVKQRIKGERFKSVIAKIAPAIGIVAGDLIGGGVATEVITQIAEVPLSKLISKLYNINGEKTLKGFKNLHIDPDISKIVDNKVETKFLEYIIPVIEAKPQNEKISRFNMNSELKDWLSNNFNKRTVTKLNI